MWAKCTRYSYVDCLYNQCDILDRELYTPTGSSWRTYRMCCEQCYVLLTHIYICIKYSTHTPNISIFIHIAHTCTYLINPKTLSYTTNFTQRIACMPDTPMNGCICILESIVNFAKNELSVARVVAWPPLRDKLSQLLCTSSPYSEDISKGLYKTDYPAQNDNENRKWSYVYFICSYIMVVFWCCFPYIVVSLVLQLITIAIAIYGNMLCDTSELKAMCGKGKGLLHVFHN